MDVKHGCNFFFLQTIFLTFNHVSQIKLKFIQVRQVIDRNYFFDDLRYWRKFVQLFTKPPINGNMTPKMGQKKT